MRQHRMINTKIFTDDRFVSLPSRARVLYADLICYADDDGFVGNLRTLVKRKTHIQPLIDAGYVHVFDNGPAVVLHWYCHNSVKPSHAKATIYEAEKALLVQDNHGLYRLKTQEELSKNFPAKEKESKENESKEKEIKGKESEEKISKENEREENKSEVKETAAVAADACGPSPADIKKEENFSVFWNNYPNKSNELQAKTTFMNMDAAFEEIMEGLEHHKKCEYWLSDNGYFIPHAHNWLKDMRWRDRPPLRKPVAASPAPTSGATGKLGPEELAAIQRLLAEEL